MMDLLDRLDRGDLMEFQDKRERKENLGLTVLPENPDNLVTKV